MSQLLLFDENDFDTVAVEKDTEIKIDYGFKLGNKYCNLDYIRIIKVLKQCPICKKYSIIKEHPQILTNEQMRKNGWNEIEPFVWVVTNNICSRKCDTKSQKQ